MVSILLQQLLRHTVLKGDRRGNLSSHFFHPCPQYPLFFQALDPHLQRQGLFFKGNYFTHRPSSIGQDDFVPVLDHLEQLAEAYLGLPDPYMDRLHDMLLM
jgi:hypothetical protein